MFSKFGLFIQATVRQRPGINKSWALVTLGDRVACERAVNEQAKAGDQVLVVKSVSMEQAMASTGSFGQIWRVAKQRSGEKISQMLKDHEANSPVPKPGPPSLGRTRSQDSVNSGSDDRGSRSSDSLGEKPRLPAAGSWMQSKRLSNGSGNGSVRRPVARASGGGGENSPARTLGSATSVRSPAQMTSVACLLFLCARVLLCCQCCECLWRPLYRSGTLQSRISFTSQPVCNLASALAQFTAMASTDPVWKIYCRPAGKPS